MKSLASDFKITCEIPDLGDIPMLDVSLFQGKVSNDCDMLDYRRHEKKSSVWRPRSHRPGHQMKIHECWPRFQLSRMRKRFLCSVGPGQTQELFRRRMYSNSCIRHCELQPKTRSAFHLTDRRNDGPWLVLPYHHSWTGNCFSRINRRLGFLGFLVELVRIGICWPMIFRKLVQLLQTSTREKRKHGKRSFHQFFRELKGGREAL